MKVLGSTFLLCGLLSVPTICLAQGPPQEQERSQDFWLLQARLITDDLLKDAAGLQRFDRALLLGRLAAIWWPNDLDHARSWMQKAINDLESEPDRESKVDRHKRLSAVRALLGIAASIDKESSARLASMLTAEAQTDTDDEAKDNATGLVQAGLDVLDKDPAQAAAFGSASLLAGRSSRLVSLLSRLRTRDRGLGDTLFIQALAAARVRDDRDLLASLTVVAFNGPAPSDDIRKRVLSVISEQFLGSRTHNAQDRGCSLAQTLVPLLAEFDVLLLEQASTVRSGLIRCQQLQASSSDVHADSSLRPLYTVDDLMEAANKASNSKDRVSYLGRAAYLAAQQKNLDRAVAILETFSDEERKDLNGVWDNWRWDFASSAAIAQLKQGDRYLMSKTIAATPAYLRGFVQISVADELASHGDLGGAVELLQEGRKGLAKLRGADSLDWYLSLVRRYAKLAPQETSVVFRELVTAVNRTEEPKAEQPIDAFGDSMPPISLPASVLETDVTTIKDATATIESSVIRIRARLGFLQSALDLARTQTRPGDKAKIQKRAAPSL